jgi:hypothetical protein
LTEDAFTPAQLEQIETVIRKAVREEFAGAGLRLDDTAHQDAAKEDFRFIRRLRLSWDGAVGKVGNAVLIAIIGVGLAIASAGFWSWIGRGGQ